MNSLDREIDAARKQVREHEQAGRPFAADLAAARLWGLVRARQLFFGRDVRPACPHLRHQQVDAVWVCVRCGEPAKR